jgi:hypothetical protein
MFKLQGLSRAPKPVAILLEMVPLVVRPWRPQFQARGLGFVPADQILRSRRLVGFAAMSSDRATSPTAWRAGDGTRRTASCGKAKGLVPDGARERAGPT